MTNIHQIDNFAANAASIPGESASVRRATEGEASSTSMGAGAPGADAAPTAMASAMRWASTADRSHEVSSWRSLKHAMSACGRHSRARRFVSTGAARKSGGTTSRDGRARGFRARLVDDGAVEPPKPRFKPELHAIPITDQYRRFDAIDYDREKADAPPAAE